MIVVTGSEGFVGKNLCERLTMDGKEFHRIDTKIGRDIASCDLPDADRVYHLAAQTDAYCTLTGFDALTNIMGSIRVFSKYGDKVVYASTSMVNFPVNPYAISKKAAEDYARYYGCSVVRFCNLYGPGGHSFFDIARSRHEVTVYGDGEQLRTWASVKTAIDVMLRVKPGKVAILEGRDMTVNAVTRLYKNKVTYAPARENDIQYAPQLVYVAPAL